MKIRFVKLIEIETANVVPKILLTQQANKTKTFRFEQEFKQLNLIR